MSVIQFTPCIVNENWAAFAEWASRVFQLPIACQYDDQGWARFTATSPGITLLSAEPFRTSSQGEGVVLELQVESLQRVLDQALAAGGSLVTEPMPLSDDQRHAAVRSPQGVLLFLYERAETARIPNTVHVNEGPVHFVVARDIKASPERVFEAMREPDDLTKVFIESADSRLGEGTQTTWTWGAEVSATMEDVSMKANEYVTFHWRAYRQPYHTRVRFQVEPRGEGARLTVTETGWNNDADSLHSAFNHCEGWTQFADNLKVYLEHGITTR